LNNLKTTYALRANPEEKNRGKPGKKPLHPELLGVVSPKVKARKHT